MQEESGSAWPAEMDLAEPARHGPYVRQRQLPLLRKRHQITQAEHIHIQFLTETPVH